MTGIKANMFFFILYRDHTREVHLMKLAGTLGDASARGMRQVHGSCLSVVSPCCFSVAVSGVCSAR